MTRSAIIRFFVRRRWEPPVRRNRHLELVQPQVSPPIRVLSGCLSLFMLWAAAFAVRYEFVDLLVVAGGVALASGWIALFGWNEVVVEPVASERFKEMADPSRPLPAAAIPKSPAGLE